MARTKFPKQKNNHGLNIIHTLLDPKLLGQFIRDPDTWSAWFTFLKAFFALSPEKQDRELYRQCTGREKWPREAAKEALMLCGRRAGKSFTVALIACFLAVFRKYNLSPGEKGRVIIVSPTKVQASLIKGYLSSFFNENSFLKSLIVRETREELELSNNVIIMVLSSDYKNIRGFTCIAGIIDEAAFHNVDGSRPLQETIRALRPALSTTGGPLILITTPYAKQGPPYETHKRHFGKDESSTLVWVAGSLTMNPTLSQDVIDKDLEEDPEAAKSEWVTNPENPFRNDIAPYVSREAVGACVASGRYELPPISGVRYSAFVDPSGGSRDSMTLAISHSDSGKKVLDCVREVRPPFSPEQVVEDFARLLRRYRVSTVTGDRYAGEWPKERFSVCGISYKVADKPKSDLYRDFLPLINSGEVELLDNERLVNQVCGLERRTSRGGRDSIDHPPNGHDDLANVCAGVLVGSARPRAGVWGTGTPLDREMRQRRNRRELQKMVSRKEA